MEPSERNFEADIEHALLKNGYIKRLSKNYDRTLCLDPDPLFDFIYMTQAKEWQKLKKYHGSDVKERFLSRLSR